jgi:hypothetical protein
MTADPAREPISEGMAETRWERASRGGNRDIWTEDDRGSYPLVEHLLLDEDLAHTFGRYDAAALRNKYLHSRLGRVALVSAGTALLLALASLAAPSLGLRLPGAASALALVAGLIPLGIEAGLRLYRVHDKWMAARLRAELIRQWRYRQFLDGSRAESEDRSARVTERDRYLQKHTTEKDYSDPAVLGRFLEQEPFEPDSSAYSDPDIFKEAMCAYWDRRLTYQQEYFHEQARRCETRDREFRWWAKALLRLSIFAAVAEAALVVSGFAQNLAVLSATFSALALALLIGTAGVRVYRSATGMAEESERYSSRSAHLLRLRGAFGDPHPCSSTQLFSREEELRGLVLEVERECWQELIEFLRLARKSSYFV